MTSHFISLFFGGAFFINAIPHFVEGISGRKFPSPFAKPPGLGDSSTRVQVALAATGGFLMPLCLAYSFGPRRENYRAHM